MCRLWGTYTCRQQPGVFLSTWWQYGIFITRSIFCNSTYYTFLKKKFPSETTKIKQSIFIASISQRYTSNWSKATLKRPTTYKRERVTKERQLKLKGIQPLVQHSLLQKNTEAETWMIWWWRLNVHVSLLVPHSEVSELKIFSLK